MKLHEVHGATSVHIASNRVQADISLIGGQIAPVVFDLGDRHVAPYSLAPWKPTDVPNAEPLLAHLRGDFFCIPFGAQPAGPLHGQVAHDAWSVERSGQSSVTLTIDAPDVGATFHKMVSVADGETVLYQQVTSTGLSGRLNYGTHPILDLSTMPTGAGRLSTSPLMYASVNPGIFSDPQRGETQILRPGAEFTDLARVPRMDGTTIDLSHYPTPAGHEDLVMLVNDPDAGPLGWSAMVFDGYLWLALKAVDQLPMTLLWLSNGGRTQSPWGGRHLGRIGIEDVCSYYATGLESSQDNDLLARGIRTSRHFDAEHQLDVRTAHLVAAVDSDFDVVAAVRNSRSGWITVESTSGAIIDIEVDWGFVLG